MQRVAKKKKKVADEKKVDETMPPVPEKKNNRDQDERFYDLDDEFIDDGDIQE